MAGQPPMQDEGRHVTTELVFSGLKAVFHQGIRRNDPTLAFELREGAGRFVFLLFCSRDDIGGARLFCLSHTHGPGAVAAALLQAVGWGIPLLLPAEPSCGHQARARPWRWPWSF